MPKCVETNLDNQSIDLAVSRLGDCLSEVHQESEKVDVRLITISSHKLLVVCNGFLNLLHAS